MKAFLALLRVNFQNLLVSSVQMGGGRRGKKISGAATLAFIAGLMMFISGVYTVPITMELAQLGGGRIALLSTLLMGLLLPAFFALFGAQGAIFTAKDMDLVFSLPVSAFSVMLARVLSIYLEALLMVECFILPAGVAYMVFAGGSPGFLLVLLLEGLLLAIFPALVSLVFGFLVSVVVARLPFKNLFTVVFSLGLVVLIILASGSMGFMADSAAMGEASLLEMEGVLAGIFPPLGWAVAGAVDLNVPAILMLAASSILPLLLLVWVFSLFYKGIITRLSSHRLKTNFKLRGVAASGSFSTLLKKEAGRFFRTPIYLLNCGITMFIMLALSAFVAFNKANLPTLLASMLSIDIINVPVQVAELMMDATRVYFAPILLGVLAFFLMAMYTSAVSLSLEGKSLWIVKSAPLSTAKIFASKILFNFILGSSVATICILLLGYGLSLKVADAAAMLLVCLLYSAFTSVNGLYMNLVFPRLDYVNEASVIKNSASVWASLGTGLVTGGILAGLYYLLCGRAGLGFVPFCGAAAVLLALLLAGALALVNTKGKQLFAAL